MNISEKKLENSIMELSIEVPADIVEHEYNDVYGKVRKSAKIDGFRKGKAPLQLVETRYAEYANKETAENLCKQFFLQAITEKQLAPLAQPRYEFDSINRGQAFSFKAIFEVPPTVELGQYKELPADQPSCEISQEDVQTEIDAIRERDAKITPKDEGGQVEKGDYVRIRVKRVDDVEPEEAEKADFKEYSIVVGKSKDESALDSHLYGMKRGEERDIEVKYPKEYAIKDLAGQKVKYLVRLDEINSMELPELNDEYAKKLQYESVDDFTRKTKEYLEKFVGEKSRGEAKSKLIRSIVESTRFDIPESMIITEMASIFRKTQERIGYYSENLVEFCKTLGMDPEEFRTRLKEEAGMSVKTALVLSEIARKEDLKINEDRYQEIVKNVASRNNKSIEEIENIFRQNDSRERIEYELLLDQAMDFIYENAKIKILKPMSLEDFMRKEA